MQPTIDSLVRTGLPLYTLHDFADADFAQEDSLTRGTMFVRALHARQPGAVVRDAHPLVDALRARKSEAEIALLRRAVAISDEGHRAAMRAAAPGLHEYDLQGEAERAFLRGGAARPGYGSIVGSGANGTQLHYMRNRGPLKAGDLVVMDMGAEYEGYSADVTRTIPVSGTYTSAQRADLPDRARRADGGGARGRVRASRRRARRRRRSRRRLAGSRRWASSTASTARIDLPWKTNCERTPVSCTQAMLFTIHGISHGIGLAVHDPAQFYDGAKVYEAGDVFTIEPGIYLSTRLLDMLPDTPAQPRVRGARSADPSRSTRTPACGSRTTTS